MIYEAFLFLAEGFEEIEAIATLDVLRRGNVSVASVSITDAREVTGAQGVTVKADLTFGELKETDGAMLILPGGPGRVNFEKHGALLELFKNHDAKGEKIAAICGSPTILGDLGILADKTAVCYPAVEPKLKSAKIGDASVVTDGNVTTSKAAGTTIDFALELLRILKDGSEAAKVAEAIVHPL